MHGTRNHHISCKSDVPLYSEGRIQNFTTQPALMCTIVIITQTEYGFIAVDDQRLQSKPLKYDTNTNGGDGVWGGSMAVHIMVATTANVLQPDYCVQQTQRP
ncbi:hypothetical protein TNCV_5007691 [Trichonephila clavipes]|nr:hypothetical protein TNCV_5007691 [Trichonephila clavipes]